MTHTYLKQIQFICIIITCLSFSFLTVFSQDANWDKLELEIKSLLEEKKFEAPPTNEEPMEETAVKTAPVRKAAVGKARRTKDPKACRPACYESGDDDLNNYFKTNLTFTKKERKHHARTNQS